MDRRLSAAGFRTVMAHLREEELFRAQLLGDVPSAALKMPPKLSDDDARIIRSIRWDTGVRDLYPIDQKLVLCSASGY